MMTMALQFHQLPLSSSLLSSSTQTHFLFFHHQQCKISLHQRLVPKFGIFSSNHNDTNSTQRRRKSGLLVGREDIEFRLQEEEEEDEDDEEDEEDDVPPSPQDLEDIQEIKRVLELLKKNRDMIFNEVKLTILIEDPREVERRRLLGIEDPDTPTREDLVDALVQVNEGKVPRNRIALRMLAEEMINWPNVEVEAPKKKPGKSLYARATDTGVNAIEAAKRLKMDWDSAAEIDDADTSDERDVPSILGFGALYLVSAFPIIIGISVVLILFYNSLRENMEVTSTDTWYMLPTSLLHLLPIYVLIFVNLLLTYVQLINLNTMVFTASDIVFSSPKKSNGETFDICGELDTLTTVEHFRELQFMAAEEYHMFSRKVSLQKERQISVDPISLRESSVREASFSLMLDVQKPHVISCSLPNTATSSPRFSFALLKKRWKNESHASPRQIDNLTYRNPAAQSHLSLSEEPHLRRSKSCAEGRSSAPADELDLWFCNPKTVDQSDSPEHQMNFSKPEVYKVAAHSTGKGMDFNEQDEFKCGALCLYLPGFAKGKPVRPKKEEAVKPEIGNRFSGKVSPEKFECGGNIISRTVSLEKFECGSWASSAIVNDHDDADSMQLYYDLPLELIRTSNNEASSPVTAAFVFDKDRKGVLKNSSTRGAVAPRNESARHVRFSTSSSGSHPTSPAACITPRLRKAREDFNAFLEAQSA